MPGCPKCTCTPSSFPPLPWTPTMAQAALAVVAWQLQDAVELLEGIHRDLPPPADLADRQEGRLAYDVATEILATIECVLEDDLRPGIEALQRAAQVTDAELEQEYQERKRNEVR
jgi:hypothetical protein